jgi:hypothetical protein
VPIARETRKVLGMSGTMGGSDVSLGLDPDASDPDCVPTKNLLVFQTLLRRCLYLFSTFFLSTMSRTNMISTKPRIPPMKTLKNLLISRVNSRNSTNLALRIVGVLLSSLRMHSEHQPRSIFRYHFLRADAPPVPNIPANFSTARGRF